MRISATLWMTLAMCWVAAFPVTSSGADQNTSQVSQLGLGANQSTETLDKEGTLVAIARRHDGCVLVDASNPQQPVIISTINPDDRAGNNATPSIDIWDVNLHNGYLYLMNRPEEIDPVLGNWVGLYIYDVTVPANPVLEGWLLWGGGIYHHLAGSVKSGTVENVGGVPHAFLCSDITSLVEVFDVSIPSAPIYQSSVMSPGYFDTATEAVVQNDTLYTAWGDGGFTIHDVAVPSLPIQLAHQPYLGSPVINGGLQTLCPTPDGQYLVSGEYTYGGDVRLWDIRNLGAITQTASWRLNSGALLWTVRATNDFAYVAHLEDGLQVLDIRNRSQMNRVGSFDPDTGSPVTTWSGIADVVIDGNRAYLSHQANGLHIVDFGDEVNITKADWHRKKKKLTVYATGSGQPDVSLDLLGYGMMSWNSKRNRYQITVSGVTSNPGTVMVFSDLVGFDESTVRVR